MKHEVARRIMQALVPLLDDERFVPDPDRRAELVALAVADEPQTDGPFLWLVDVDPPVVVVRPKWTERERSSQPLAELDYESWTWSNEELLELGPEEHPQSEGVGNYYYDDWSPSAELEEEVKGLSEEEADRIIDYFRREETWEGFVHHLGNHYFAHDAHLGGRYHLGNNDDGPEFPMVDYIAIVDD